MNRGGFSWKRALGVTRAKQRISRTTRIPLTKSGRQRKIGRLVTGGGCLISVWFAALLVLMVAACPAPAGPVLEQYVASPATSAIASPTDLATEPVAPTVGPTRVLPAANLPSSYYTPPGWDGVSDVDCSDFDTQEHAQSFFLGTGGSATYDPYRLDRDHDAKVCESLP